MAFGSHLSTTPRRGICEQLPQISVRVLEKRGMLTEGSPLYDKWVRGWGFLTDLGGIDIRADYYRATFSFAVHGEKRETTVDVVRTPIFRRNHFWKGYHKTYFKCPACGSRCEILYVRITIKCRSCHGLKYQSQKATAWTALKTIKRIQKRLGDGSGSIWADPPPRPKGMRYKTYERLERELVSAQRKQFRHDEPPAQAWR